MANYRLTVLTAFQQVEDNVAARRIPATEIEEQDAAVKAAQRFLTLATDRYKLGIRTECRDRFHGAGFFAAIC